MLLPLVAKSSRERAVRVRWRSCRGHGDPLCAVLISQHSYEWSFATLPFGRQEYTDIHACQAGYPIKPLDLPLSFSVHRREEGDLRIIGGDGTVCIVSHAERVQY